MKKQITSLGAGETLEFDQNNGARIDPLLQNIARAVDLEQMREAFQYSFLTPVRFGAAADSFPRLLSCHIIRRKHKPGKYGLICYRLTLIDSNNKKQELIISARVFTPGGSESRYRKALAAGVAQTPIGDGVRHLPRLDMVCWIFPNDRKLAALPKFSNAKTLGARTAPKLIQSLAGEKTVLLSHRVEIAHYASEHACTLKIDARFLPGQKDGRDAVTTARTATFFGKTYISSREAARRYSDMMQLWERRNAGERPLFIPRPLAFEAAANAVWQLGLRGRQLADFSLQDDALPGHLEASAQNVAALHEQKLPSAETSGLKEMSAQLQKAAALFKHRFPHSAEMIEQRVEALLMLSAEMPNQDQVLLHGDLHLKNFFLSQGRVYLIDLDTLSTGPAARDLGSLAAALIYRGLLENISSDRIERLVAVFWKTYNKTASTPVDGFSLQWYTAAALIAERVYRCLSRMKTGRVAVVDELIAAADERIAEVRKSSCLCRAPQGGETTGYEIEFM